MTTTEELDKIKSDRQRVYGDPRENHRGIAQAWAGLLQPHAERIRRGEPIPEWTVALLMAALKLNRMRRVYSKDNYDDIFNYLQFAADWQAPAQERIYVAGPYSAPTLEGREANVFTASVAAWECMRRGHLAHCPHAATHPIENIDGGDYLNYEQYMALDFAIIERWATAVLVIASSPGADREVALAEKLNLKVFRCLEDVPTVEKRAA